MSYHQKADNEWRDHASLPPYLFKVETSDKVKKLSVESYGQHVRAPAVTVKYPGRTIS